MAWELPDFNTTINCWNTAHNPTLSPPDLVLQGQLYVNTKINVVTNATFFQTFFMMAYLRFPYVPGQLGRDWLFECPAGYGQYLLAIQGFRVHLGFPNEYLEILVTQSSPTRISTPWLVW